MSPFKLVSVVVPAHTARALHYTVTGWQNFQDKIVSPREELEYVVTQPELTLQEPSQCKHNSYQAAVIPSTGNISGSEMLISFPFPGLHLGWRRLCSWFCCVLSFGCPLCSSWKHQSAGKCTLEPLLQKDLGSNQMQSKAHQGGADFSDICSMLKASLWLKTKSQPEKTSPQYSRCQKTDVSKLLRFLSPKTYPCILPQSLHCK